MTRLRPRRATAGFTLTETIVSLAVFSIVTLGLVPLLASSMRASTLSRSSTIGKNAAVEAMERVRGLPYFIEYTRQRPNTRADVLDFYFPRASAPLEFPDSQSYSNGVFTTTCARSSLGTTGNPACAFTIPTGHTVTFTTRFVRPVGTGSSQTYETVVPGSNYAWNYDVATATPTDRPASQLLEVIVGNQWNAAGRDRTAQLRTLVGDRKFADVAVSGEAKIDYGVQVLTSFVDSTGAVSDLTVRGGSASSSISARLTSAATEALGTGHASLVQGTTTLATLDRPGFTYTAPPDSSPAATTAPSTASVMTHPGSGLNAQEIAGLDRVRLQNVQVTVADEAPVARGEYAYAPAGGSIEDVWVNNQPDPNRSLYLDRTKRMFAARTDATGRSVFGSTRASTLVSPSRAVETTATVELRDVRLLPVANPGPRPGDPNPVVPSDGVVIIDSFSATVTCRSAASGTTERRASWTASIRYWKDAVKGKDKDRLGGAYVSATLSNTSPSTLRAAIGENPLVYDAPSGQQDVYLFQEGTPGTTGFRRGYLSSWDHLAGDTQESGRVRSASIDGAIRIVTSPTTNPGASPSYPQSGLSISLGKLGCRAEDRR